MTSTVGTQDGFRPRTQRLLEALDQAWGHGNVDALDHTLSPDFCRSGRTSTQTREQLKQSILSMRRSFPDLRMTVARVIEGADDVAFYWTSTGTLSDEYLGLPATGREYSISGANFCQFNGDLVQEELVVYDRRGQYSSLGVPLNAGSSADHGDIPVEAGELRQLHRKLVTGVTVVTVDNGGEPRGLAVNAFSSVSLEPPLVLVCVQKNSSTYSRLIATKHFGISVLSAEQIAVAKVFATKQDRKFDKVRWHRGTYGVPLIDEASATMEVQLQDTLHSQTHTIFIGRVKQLTFSNAAPLVYTAGAFFDGGQLVAAIDPTA